MRQLPALFFFCALIVCSSAQCQAPSPDTAHRTSNYFISVEAGVVWNSLLPLKTLDQKVSHVYPSSEMYVGYKVNSVLSFAAGVVYGRTPLCYRDSIARYMHRSPPQTYYSPEVYETYISKSFTGLSLRMELNAVENRFRYGMLLSVSGGIAGKNETVSSFSATYFYNRISSHSQSLQQHRSTTFSSAGQTSLQLRFGYQFAQFYIYGTPGVSCWLARKISDEYRKIIRPQIDPFIRVGVEYRW